MITINLNVQRLNRGILIASKGKTNNQKLSTENKIDSVELSKTKKENLTDKIKKNKKLIAISAIGIITIIGAIFYAIKKRGSLDNLKNKNMPQELSSGQNFNCNTIKSDLNIENTNTKIKKRHIKKLSNKKYKVKYSPTQFKKMLYEETDPINITKRMRKRLIKSFSVQEKSKEIQKRGYEIAENAQKQYKEAELILKQAKEKGFCDKINTEGKSTLFFTLYGSEKAMEEIENGKVVRRIEFNSDSLDISNIRTNYLKTSEHGYKCAEEYIFYIGVFDNYKSNYALAENSESSTFERFNFYKNKPVEYQKGHKKNIGTRCSIDENYKFDNDELRYYTEGYNINEFNSITANLDIKFKNGKTDEITSGTLLVPNAIKSYTEKYAKKYGKLSESALTI